MKQVGIIGGRQVIAKAGKIREVDPAKTAMLALSMHHALRAIADTKIKRDTDTAQLSALLISIARVELDKWRKV